MADPIVVPELVLDLDLAWSVMPSGLQHLAILVGAFWALGVTTMAWRAAGWLLFGARWRAIPSLVALGLLTAYGLPARAWEGLRALVGDDGAPVALSGLAVGLPLAVLLALRDRQRRPLDLGRLAAEHARRRRAAVTFG